jgi:hypothetical protein
MPKRRANIYMAAVLLMFAKRFGFERRDPRLSKKTRTIYAALVRGRYRCERKHSNAFRRWHRSICADARAAGLVPYRVA